MSAKIVLRVLALAALLAAVWLLSSLVLGPFSLSASWSSSPFSSRFGKNLDPSQPLDPHQEYDRAKALAATSPISAGPQPTRILAWTKVNGHPGFESFHINFCGPSAPTCIVTHHRSLLNDSAALLFSSTDLSLLDLPTTYPNTYGARDPLQPWVLYSEVSPLEHPVPYPLLDPAWTRLFDYSMSYRLDSDFPIPAIAGVDLVAAVSAPLDLNVVESRFAETHRQPQPSPILWLASNGSCTSDNHRHLLVAALEAAGLAVDSLNGACPTTLGHAVSAPDGNLVALFQQYKFVLVLETSNCKDYVSRSLVHALQAQTLPIVDGPPLASYRQLLGTERLDTVLMADTGNANATAAADLVAHLVARVQALATSKQAYLDHMRAARASPIDPSWRTFWTSARFNRGRRSGWCGLCSAAAQADTLRTAERAYQAQALAARALAEDRLAHSMAEVDQMRSQLLAAVKQHATSAKQRKRIAAKFGSQAARAALGPWNATTWRNASTYLPLPAGHPLGAPRKHAPPKRALLAPDYSCQLGKWAPETGEPESQPAHIHARYLAQGLPADFLAHALPDSAPEVKWPRPVGRRKRGKSRYADLTGELARAVANKHQANKGPGMLGSGAQVMDPSEAKGAEDFGKVDVGQDLDQERVEQQRKPRLELEYPPLDAADGEDGDEAMLGNWDVLDGMLVGLFITGIAGMYASALGLSASPSHHGHIDVSVPLVGGLSGAKRKHITSLTSTMAGKSLSPTPGVRLLPLRRQSVTHHGSAHQGFVTSPVQEEAEESSGLKVL